MSTHARDNLQIPDAELASSPAPQNLKFEREDFSLFRTVEGLQQKAGLDLRDDFAGGRRKSGGTRDFSPSCEEPDMHLSADRIDNPGGWRYWTIVAGTITKLGLCSVGTSVRFCGRSACSHRQIVRCPSFICLLGFSGREGLLDSNRTPIPAGAGGSPSLGACRLRR